MPDLRSEDTRDELATVIGLYALGELTLGKAASRMEMTRFEMKEILNESDVELRLGPRNEEEVLDEVMALRDE